MTGRFRQQEGGKSSDDRNGTHQDHRERQPDVGHQLHLVANSWKNIRPIGAMKNVLISRSPDVENPTLKVQRVLQFPLITQNINET